MKKINFRQTIVNGLFLALPVIAVLYFGYGIVKRIEKVIAPVADKLNIHHLLGEVSLTVIALIILFVAFFILGLLLRIDFLEDLNEKIESVAYKLVPKLHKIKSLAADDEENTFSEGWDTVLLKDGDTWVPAYITEKGEKLITVFIPGSPDGKTGQVKMMETSSANYKPIEGLKLRSIVRHFGKGFIETYGTGK